MKLRAPVPWSSSSKTANRWPNSCRTVHAGKARGVLKNELFIAGDIISPIDVAWDALK